MPKKEIDSEDEDLES